MAAGVALVNFQHLVHHSLLGGGLETDVKKTWSGDFDGLHPACKSGRGLQRRLELLAQRSRVELERLGQLHGGGTGKVAMRRHLG